MVVKALPTGLALGYSRPVSSARTNFDHAYYERFYADPTTRVADGEEDAKLARFVVSYLDYLGVTLSSALDCGCGNGRWKTALQSVLPNIEYTGVELSADMCRTHGWNQGSVAQWQGQPADLVVCHGVLQYLSDSDAKRAIENLARHTDKALYLEAVTKEDWQQNVDQVLTDGEINLRKASWYRKQLSAYFDSAGGGIFLPKNSSVVLYELERGL